MAEVALDGIESLIDKIIKEEEELTNEIDQEFDKVKCSFYQFKNEEINECEAYLWGVVLLQVVNGLIVAFIIACISILVKKTCCNFKPKPEMIEPIQ